MTEEPGTAMVLIPFGNERLALTREEFEQAMKRGRELMPNQTPSTPAHAEDRIVDAEGASVITDVPATWFMEQARQEAIPHMRFGKYVRFKLSELLEAVTVQRENNLRRKSS